MNSKTIDRNCSSAAEYGNVFRIEADGKLTIDDSTLYQDGTIKGGYANQGGAFYNEGTLSIWTGDSDETGKH